MTAVFADTSYYIALLSPQDQYHQAALRISAQLRQSIVVTEFVLVEVMNALAPVESRTRAVELWAHLSNDPSVRIVPASSHIAASGVSLYAQRFDKNWSLTDCISFVVMRDQGLTEALTADHHFEQAGFTPLLRMSSWPS